MILSHLPPAVGLRLHVLRSSNAQLLPGIKNENWQAAARDLGAHALMLYMYLANGDT